MPRKLRPQLDANTSPYLRRRALRLRPESADGAGSCARAVRRGPWCAPREEAGATRKQEHSAVQAPAVRRRAGRSCRVLFDRPAHRRRRDRDPRPDATLVHGVELDCIAALIPLVARSFVHVTLIIFDTDNERQARAAYDVARRPVKELNRNEVRDAGERCSVGDGRPVRGTLLRATAGPSAERCCGRRQARPRNAVAASHASPGDTVQPVRGPAREPGHAAGREHCDPADEGYGAFGGDPELIGGRRRVSGAMVNEAVGNAWGATGGDPCSPSYVGLTTWQIMWYYGGWRIVPGLV